MLTHFRPVISKSSGIRFILPHTTGKTEGEVKTIAGSVAIDLPSLTEAHGSLAIPIRSISTGDETQDCHLLEALGLDYEKSDYPEKHVGRKNKLDEQGKNAISYPEITFHLQEIQKQDGKDSYTIKGEWCIHGVSVPGHFSAKITKSDQKLRVLAEVLFSLKDYGIEVKPVQILFLKLKVQDEVKVLIDLELIPA